MLLRLEILIFLLSFGYILFYIIDFVYLKFAAKFKLKKYIKKLDDEHSKIREKDFGEESSNFQSGEDDADGDDISDEIADNPKIHPASIDKIEVYNSEQIREIIKRAQINISRGYLETARNIVIEGLAMKKQDKELNILLAEIYEREKKYQHAAYIYKDLYDEHQEDVVIMQKLGNALYLLGDNNAAFDIYVLVHKKNRSNTEVLDILSHLAMDIKDYKAGVKYANCYLKEKPRNAEKLGIKAYCLEKLGRLRESIEAYKKILDVQPYNSEVIERIKILESRSDSQNED